MKSLVSVVLLFALVGLSLARGGCPKPKFGGCTSEDCLLGTCVLLNSCNDAAAVYCSCTENNNSTCPGRSYCKTITLGFGGDDGDASISFCTHKDELSDCTEEYSNATEFCKVKGPRPEGRVAADLDGARVAGLPTEEGFEDGPGSRPRRRRPASQEGVPVSADDTRFEDQNGARPVKGPGRRGPGGRGGRRRGGGGGN